ncbi:hypothetical protein GUJ93_ZPchr0006g41936 [Zizania palustris]|uniref:Uncharacterized protein n=1 Tax=Zizania palustris TaxID=103762 RepID=A0A8J5VKQ6_ZIZPA|nr:hypothetical protein GUJ93_ZPchr0006g41936 [Zizania palustris]
MASMAGAPRVRSLNITAPEAETDVDARPVLVPGGNKAKSAPAAARKPCPKPTRKADAAVGTPEKPAAAAAGKGSSPLPSPRWTQPSPRKHDVPVHLNLSLNASCSSEASVESLRGRPSGGRLEKRFSRSGVPRRGKTVGKVAAEKGASDVDAVTPATLEARKRRCALITPTTDPCYAIFHDEEWGVPVHDDKRLFELLVLSCALAELTWPEILKRRQLFREIFMDFDPVATSKINEKKLVAPGSVANSLLSEQKLRAVVENARQILKITDEFGSFDQYCWGFLNHKPIVNKFRYPRQVPVKSPRADMISKDMVRRGFRGVGPTVIYSFMQAAGLTNDHLVSCFRFKECNEAPALCTNDTNKVNAEEDLNADDLRTKIGSEEMAARAELSRTIDTLIIS